MGTAPRVTRPVIVAHRAANDLTRIPEASRHADVVEADVHLFGGRLEIRHAKTLGPFPILWERWHLVERARPPLILEHLLEAMPLGPDLMLDLKGPDPRLAPAVARAIRGYAARRRVLVSSRVWRSVERLRGQEGISTLHSVGSERQLRSLVSRHGPDSLEGVSVHRRLLDRSVVHALRERAGQVWSWPVNDAQSARVLGEWGVTGLISDAPELLRPAIAPHARAGR